MKREDYHYHPIVALIAIALFWTILLGGCQLILDLS